MKFLWGDGVAWVLPQPAIPLLYAREAALRDLNIWQPKPAVMWRKRGRDFNSHISTSCVPPLSSTCFHNNFNEGNWVRWILPGLSQTFWYTFARDHFKWWCTSLWMSPLNSCIASCHDLDYKRINKISLQSFPGMHFLWAQNLLALICLVDFNGWAIPPRRNPDFHLWIASIKSRDVISYKGFCRISHGATRSCPP